MSLFIGLGTLGVLATVGVILIILGTQGFFNTKDNSPLNPDPQPNCGISQIKSFSTEGAIQQRIINGKDVIPNSHPWMVSLRAAKMFNAHFCGGVLIYPDVVITAAHCVNKFKTEEILIATGIHQRNENLTNSNSYNVTIIKYHENYVETTKSNDIALLKLSKPVSLSPKVSVICLPNSKTDHQMVYDKNLTAIGWYIYIIA